MQQLTRIAVDQDQAEQDDGPWSDKVEFIGNGEEEEPNYRPRKPILGPLGLSESSLKVFCEMATIVLTDFGRCRYQSH
jgi:hypothetical protein